MNSISKDEYDKIVTELQAARTRLEEVHREVFSRPRPEKRGGTDEGRKTEGTFFYAGCSQNLWSWQDR